MEIVNSILTKNPCYTAGRKITVKGLMLHSVGCSQPKASVFINSWNKESYSRACVHAFIDGNDGKVYQTLPWDHRGWHAGSSINGSANNSHIGVEMCEPATIKYTSGFGFKVNNAADAKAVAERTYKSAVELFAFLCKTYRLDPLATGVIISHSEGHKRGVASNHGDPEHLWKGLKLSYTMDGFREDVKKAMGEVVIPEKTATTMSEKELWDFFKSKGMNDYGVAGLLGNLYAESGLRANNLQNSYEKKLNITDVEYTRLVDGGNYPDFVTDKAGYGLAQWTYHSRKQYLLKKSQEMGTSIGDARMQCEYLMWELESSYPSVLRTLKNAQSVREASDVVLKNFERPADQSEKVQIKRASYGQGYFDKYAGGGKTEVEAKQPTKTTDELAREVIKGLWGNGTERKQRLTAAGYDYKTIQSRVNELCK